MVRGSVFDMKDDASGGLVALVTSGRTEVRKLAALSGFKALTVCMQRISPKLGVSAGQSMK
jgi:hypothetical protein